MGISIQLGDPQRVAGFVKPGSEVALFTTASGVGGEAEQQTTILLPRVLIAAVGPTVVAQAAAEGTGNTEAIPTAIMTLALTQEEAQKVDPGLADNSVVHGPARRQLRGRPEDFREPPQTPSSTDDKDSHLT